MPQKPPWCSGSGEPARKITEHRPVREIPQLGIFTQEVLRAQCPVCDDSSVLVIANGNLRSHKAVDHSRFRQLREDVAKLDGPSVM